MSLSPDMIGPPYIISYPSPTMSYFEPTQIDAAEIMNLKRIVQLCNIPDVGPSPLDPDLTPDVRYTNALSTLEKTSGVFNPAFYQDAVFAEEIDEDLLDEELIRTARAKGVSEQHLPANCMRSLPAPPLGPIIPDVVLEKKELPPTPEESDEATPDNCTGSAASYRSTSTDKRSFSSRPSLSLKFRKFSMTNSFKDSRPGTPVSLISTFSRSSSATNNPRQTKTRNTLTKIFRTSPKRPSGPVPSRPDASGLWIPVPADCDVPPLDSSRSDQASTTSPSTSLSSRTSASSFADLHTFSWLDSRTLQKCTKSPSFIAIRIRCQDEAKRFIDFTQHQRVALPLFLGRSRMYLESRIEIRIEDMKRRHLTAIEELENKHLMQEIHEVDEQKTQTDEQKTKNATALKHMHKRLSLLGDQVTPTERARVEEEKLALHRLAERQQREIRNLFRVQNREKMDLQRKQQKELEDFERILRESYREAVKEKQGVLQENMKSLEALIHTRSVKLISRWWLLLQIWKKNEGERIMVSCGNVVKGPLPLGLLGLPEDFAPYVASFH